MTDPAATDTWTCPSCSAENPMDVVTCLECRQGTRPLQFRDIPSPGALALRHRLVMLGITFASVALILLWIGGSDEEPLPYVEHSIASCTIDGGASGMVWNRSDAVLDTRLDVAFVDDEDRVIGARTTNVSGLPAGELAPWSVGGIDGDPSTRVTCLVLPEVTVVD